MFRYAKKQKKSECRNIVQKGPDEPFKFGVVLNIGNTQFLTEFEALYPRKTHTGDMRKPGR